MSFGTLVLLISTILYIVAGVAFTWFEGKTGLGIAYLAYGAANVGLMMEAMK